ncbi:hypothetical protein D3C76_996830 [compost metagenome]
MSVSDQGKRYAYCDYCGSSQETAPAVQDGFALTHYRLPHRHGVFEAPIFKDVVTPTRYRYP